MNNKPPAAQETSGIRPGVWLAIVASIIAIGVIGFLARRDDKSDEATAAEASHSESTATPFQSTTAPSGAGQVPSVEEAPVLVQAVFKKYSRALLDGDGEAAWSMVDFHTRRFYGQMLQDALSLPAKDLNRLDDIHKITVLRLHTEFRKTELQALTDRDVFVLSVTNGWISKSTIQSLPELQKVTVNGRYAQAYLPIDSKTPAFYFIYEDSQWKVALWKIIELAHAFIRQMKEESGLSEKEFVLTMLRNVSKFNVNEQIFEGPID